MCIRDSIDTAHGPLTMKEWLEDQTLNLAELPKLFLLKILELCMTENCFCFRDQMFKQTNGTATGTPCAVVHANLCAGRSERTTMTKKHKKNLPFLGGFTDDMMGIWRFDNDHNEFQEFSHK